MNVIVLAAGYGTGLGPLGRDRPKGLLQLGGRPLLDYLLAGLSELPGPLDIHVVTNRRFLPAFTAWAGEHEGGFSSAPTILDDGTYSPDERLGAVGDLSFGLKHAGYDRDVLVMVTDTLFGFSLGDFVREFDQRTDADVLLAIQEEKDRKVLRRRGVVTLADDSRVTRFQEKPDEPCSTSTALPIYLLRSTMLSRVSEYLRRGGNPDAPGHLIEWLVDRVHVVGWTAPGSRADVGTPESYRSALDRFGP